MIFVLMTQRCRKMAKEKRQVKTPWFPKYRKVRILLQAYDGEAVTDVRDMERSIREQSGTPQDPVDWSKPDEWMEKRLSGKSQEIARKLWDISKGELNPRYTKGNYLLCTNFGLMKEDNQGNLRVTRRGQFFLDGNAALIREIDEAEGLIEILRILASGARFRRGDILPEWDSFVRRNSKFKTDITIKDTLRRRLLNLVDRELVSRDGGYYRITTEGLEYHAEFAPAAQDPMLRMLKTIAEYNEGTRKALLERLRTISPYRLEELVGELLDSMGYGEVEITKPSNDKGVDVIAKGMLGITPVKEVVQV